MARGQARIDRDKLADDANEQPSTSEPPETLIFISHDHRDSELAEAFEHLIFDSSAGVVKCFRSSDKSGTSGIEYGSIWYDAVMEKLENASSVVALLTTSSLDRPWILYEVGVARGKLDATAFGLVLGVPLEVASHGPFAQFHNSESDEDSLVKLVFQLVTPHATPRDQVVRGFVRTFKANVESILDERGNIPTKARKEDNSAAKLFEEIKILLGDIPRIANSLDHLLNAGQLPPSNSKLPVRKPRTLDVPYELNINDAQTIVYFAPTWQRAFAQMGGPDSAAAKKLIMDVAEWFEADLSRLESGRHSGIIGDLGFSVERRADGRIRISNYGRGTTARVSGRVVPGKVKS